NPHPTLARMREVAPIYHLRHMEFGSYPWLVTRYEDSIRLLNDERFTKDDARIPRQGQPSGEKSADDLMMEGAAAINRHMLTLDPPDHTRLRGLIHKAFTPNMIRALEARIQEITDGLIDTMIEKGGGDFIQDFAFPLPVTVIAELLGIPREDRDKFREWSQAIIMGGTRGADYEKVGIAALEFIMYFHEKFDERRAAPKDDLITALVQAEEAGDKLDPQELISMVFLLLVAGHETTVNLLGNGILALMQHPAERSRLSQHPELIRTAIEELLRYDGPVGVSTMRWALEDVEYYGEIIPAGEMVVASLLSANRDPEMFANPDGLDITRNPNKHIAFGNGIHYCVGAPLARMEGAIAINTLLRRVPNLALTVDADTLEWNPTILLHGMKHMSVTTSG
ncbi:MAG: cytochrome P450, partial [Chloroflexota bacterium]